MALILDDDDLTTRLHPADAVTWMRAAVLAHAEGALHSPARLHAALGGARLVFTAGALQGHWYGYRSYDTYDVDPGEQVVVLHARDTGRVEAVAVGSLLGQLRTGALGGVAVDLLADPAADRLGVVGSGRQAWAQVWAISAVRRLREVAVYSRDPARAAAFARRVTEELAIDCVAADTARAAVEDRAIVVLATDSRVPVVDAEGRLGVNSPQPAYAGSSRHPTRTTPSSRPATARGTRSSTSSGGGGRSARTPASSGSLHTRSARRWRR